MSMALVNSPKDFIVSPICECVGTTIATSRVRPSPAFERVLCGYEPTSSDGCAEHHEQQLMPTDDSGLPPNSPLQQTRRMTSFFLYELSLSTPIQNCMWVKMIRMAVGRGLLFSVRLQMVTCVPRLRIRVLVPAGSIPDRCHA
jgi:hypothetical protein